MGQELAPNQLQRLMDQYGKLQDDFILNGGYEMDAEMDRVSHGLNIIDLIDKPFSLLSGGEKTKVGLALSLLKKPELSKLLDNQRTI